MRSKPSANRSRTTSRSAVRLAGAWGHGVTICATMRGRSADRHLARRQQTQYVGSCALVRWPHHASRGHARSSAPLLLAQVQASRLPRASALRQAKDAAAINEGTTQWDARRSFHPSASLFLDEVSRVRSLLYQTPRRHKHAIALDNVTPIGVCGGGCGLTMIPTPTSDGRPYRSPNVLGCAPIRRISVRTHRRGRHAIGHRLTYPAALENSSCNASKVRHFEIVRSLRPHKSAHQRDVSAHWALGKRSPTSESK
jgi:hypothetical protein